MKAHKMAPSRPPWWCKAALYAALWPRAEFSEYRVALHRKYLRLVRDKGIKAAKKYARRQAVDWFWAFGWRVVRSTVVLFHIAR